MEFRRRIHIAPGVSLNLSKHGVGLSVGVKGIHYSIGQTGQHVSVGLPGTGLYYRQKVGAKSKQSKTTGQSHRHTPVEAPASAPVQKPGITASASEKSFYEGAMAYQEGNYEQAHDYFRPLINDTKIANDALLMGALSGSYSNQYEEAIDMLTVLLASDQSLLPGEPLRPCRVMTRTSWRLIAVSTQLLAVVREVLRLIDRCEISYGFATGETRLKFSKVRPKSMLRLSMAVNVSAL